MEYLIEQGADIEAEKSEEDTPLVRDLAEGDNGYARTDTVRILLRGGADPKVLDENSLICVNRAAKLPESVRLLVEQGTDPMLV